MSSQEAVHVSLIEVTPRSGKETLGTWWCHRQRGGRTQRRHKPSHEKALSCEQTTHSRGVCEPALEPRGEGEGSQTRGQDLKPDLGNPAVRHYRGGLRKRSHGGNEIPTRNRKSGLGNPPPTAGASELYPNQNPKTCNRLLATVDIEFVHRGLLPIPHIQPLSRSSIICTSE
jgi:hypothetical protein